MKLIIIFLCFCFSIQAFAEYIDPNYVGIDKKRNEILNSHCKDAPDWDACSVNVEKNFLKELPEWGSSSYAEKNYTQLNPVQADKTIKHLFSIYVVADNNKNNLGEVTTEMVTTEALWIQKNIFNRHYKNLWPFTLSNGKKLIPKVGV